MNEKPKQGFGEMRRRGRGRRQDKNRREAVSDTSVSWVPKTDLGRRVLAQEFSSLDTVLALGKPIMEPEIVDYFIKDLIKEKLEVRTTQRVTDSGKKNQFRVLMLVGDGNGHFGLGVGKNAEMTPAVNNALRDAKLNIMKIDMGSGSWEDKGGAKNSLPIKVSGRKSSVVVTLIPAPRGVGVAANPVVRKILVAAGLKDVWSFSKGNTANVFNTAYAVKNAFEKLATMRIQSWDKHVEDNKR